MSGNEGGPRERTFTWQDPMVGAKAAPTMPGIEYLRAIVRGELPPPPLAMALGLELEEVEEGRAVFALTPAEYHYNPIGGVHGGVAATIMDSAMGCAVHSTLPAGSGYGTLELKVNFLRQITVQSGRLRCEGTLIHAGRTTALAEARVTDDAGKLLAHGTSTCIILRNDPRG